MDGCTVTKPGLGPGQLPVPTLPGSPPTFLKCSSTSLVSPKAGSLNHPENRLLHSLLQRIYHLPQHHSWPSGRPSPMFTNWLLRMPFNPYLSAGGETHTQAAAWPRLWPRSHQKLVANPSGTGNHSSCHYQMTPRCRLPSEPWRRQHLNALITVHMSLDWDAQPRSCLQLELKGVW